MPAASVVLVNGLWLGNVALALLARRLRHAGFAVRGFSYPTTRNDLRTNAGLLQRFLATVPGETVHLVGFSLGGLVIRALFQFHPDQRPGRIVLLGSPQVRSRAAEALARAPVTAWLLGRSLADLNAGRPQAWAWPARATGVIAGTLPTGLGRLVTRLPAPHDGTVAVEETGLPGAGARLTLRASHFGLLLSPTVARQVGAFLRTGAFAP
jgi:pimeloyl-ACP methyl ester carboxylesterase